MGIEKIPDNINEATFLETCNNCGNFLKVIHGNDHRARHAVKVNGKWKDAGCSCLAAQITKEEQHRCKECGHTVIFVHQMDGELSNVSCSNPEPKFD